MTTIRTPCAETVPEMGDCQGGRLAEPAGVGSRLDSQHSSPQAVPGTTPFARRALVLGGLMAVAAVLHGWAVANTVVPARDCIGFVQIAQRLQASVDPETLREGPQHPLYPLLTAAAHGALGALGLASGAERWCLAAQSVASAASVLLLVPFYFSVVRLFDTRIAAGATVLMAVLPAMVQIGSDGLSDSTHLLFFLTGFWCAQEFIASRRAVWLLAAGMASGLAYLTRPEGLVLAAALVLTLVVFQIVPSYRLAWRKAGGGLACLTAGTALVAGPYVAAIGELTPKHSLGHILDAEDEEARAGDVAEDAPPIEGTRIPPGVLAQVPPRGLEEPAPEIALPEYNGVMRFRGYGGASWAFLGTLVEVMHYVLALAALIGMVAPLEKRPRAVDVPVLAVLALFLPALIQFASNAGYLSSRHVLVLASFGLMWAAYGGWRVAGWMAVWMSRSQPESAVRSPLAGRPPQARIALVMLLLAAAFCLPRALQPLHASARGHREAGRWLAAQTAPDSVVFDTHGWAAFFAERTSYGIHETQAAFRDPQLAYIVIEGAESTPGDDFRGALQRIVEAAGEPVAEFPSDDAQHPVRIYRWRPERLTQGLDERSAG